MKQDDKEEVSDDNNKLDDVLLVYLQPYNTKI